LIFTVIFTTAIEVQIVIKDLEIQQFAHHGLDLLDAGITKLDDFAAIHAYQMVMLLKPVGLLILCKVFSKLVLGDEITADEQFKGIINSRPAHAVV
jgi:hypothetical protein